MSKLSYFFIFIILSCFAALIAFRGNEYYRAYTAKVNERLEKEAGPSPFNKINQTAEEPKSAISLLSESLGDLEMKPLGSADAAYSVQTIPQDRAVSKYDGRSEANPLSAPATKNGKLQNEAVTAFSKYADRPVVKRFNADMSSIGLKNIDLSHTDGQQIAAMIQNNPQAQMTLLKYAQDPEFQSLLKEMSADPEIQKITQQARQQ